jgi:lysophospholipase L1-like esterase
MQKHHRLVYIASVLGLTLLLAFGTATLLHFIERAHPSTNATHHFIILSIVRKQEPDQNAIRIMPLGDSITAGIGTIDRGGYREPLWEKCQIARWDVTFVGSQQDGPSSLLDRNNEGHPGWRIDQISARVVGWLEATQPQIILLHIGTNDIIQGYSPAVAAARLQYLLDQITTTEPNADVIIAQIIPLGRPLLDIRVAEYNSYIPIIAHQMAARGKHVICIDMYNIVPTSDLVDGIHPDVAGYALMANEWYQALKPIMAGLQKK